MCELKFYSKNLSDFEKQLFYIFIITYTYIHFSPFTHKETKVNTFFLFKDSKYLLDDDIFTQDRRNFERKKRKKHLLFSRKMFVSALALECTVN